MTLNKLFKVLELNEKLTLEQLRLGDKASGVRLSELNLHRALIKDCIIEKLSKRINLRLRRSA